MFPGIIGLLLIAFAVIVLARERIVRTIDAGLEWCDNLLGMFDRRPGVAAAVLLAVPIAILGVFSFFPLLYAMYISLFDTRRGRYIGLGNYTRAWADPEFWRSTKVTLYYAAGAVPIAIVLSFLIAWLLFRIARLRGFFRTVYFLPYVTSVVAAATVWRVLLRPQSGFVNLLLGKIGLEPQTWLIEPRGVLHLLSGGAIPADIGPSLALACIIAFDVWHSSGFMIVVFLAGLSAIPRQLEETARLDGAGTFDVVRHITLPLLSPTIFFLVIVSGIKSFQAFNSFYALVNARGEDTQNLIVYIYAQFYENQHIGYGASIAVIMCAAIVLLSVVQWQVAGRKVYYE
ncbi:MAG: sugar ABC transporter permease [Candidatus Hydrogenedentes bacterium]|nr:sugar ABC transporter permease [Candidatus Hydrogenedentota bacterium]